MTKTNKSVRTSLVNSIVRLSNIPYSIYCKNSETEIYLGFKLLSNVSLSGIKRGRQTEQTGIGVSLSPEITRQYLKKRCLSRPEQLTKIRSEIGFLLWLYLEPRLESRGGEEYRSSLMNLIKELHLPKAKWHTRPSVRRDFFSNAIEEIKNKKTGSGKTIELKITNGISDYILVAKANYKPTKESSTDQPIQETTTA